MFQRVSQFNVKSLKTKINVKSKVQNHNQSEIKLNLKVNITSRIQIFVFESEYFKPIKEDG